MPKTLMGAEASFVRNRLNSPGDDDLSNWTSTLLTEIAAGRQLPPATRHPLGFTCVQLYRGPGWGLCLHIWESPRTSSTLTTTPIHSHSWDLSSRVLCGRLRNFEIRVTDGAPAPTHRVLKIVSVGGNDLIHPTQRLVRCAYAASAAVDAGQSYTMRAGTFHESRPSSTGVTATLLLAETRAATLNYALGRLDSHDHVVMRQACPTEDLRLLAKLTLRKVRSDL